MGMQNSHPCKALFIEEDEEEEAYFDIESELGTVANRGILFLSVYRKVRKIFFSYMKSFKFFFVYDEDVLR